MRAEAIDHFLLRRSARATAARSASVAMRENISSPALTIASDGTIVAGRISWRLHQRAQRAELLGRGGELLKQRQQRLNRLVAHCFAQFVVVTLDVRQLAALFRAVFLVRAALLEQFLAGRARARSLLPRLRGSGSRPGSVRTDLSTVRTLSSSILGLRGGG
jgi:hypothetical protein